MKTFGIKNFGILSESGCKQIKKILQGQKQTIKFKVEDPELKFFDNYFFKPINQGELEKTEKIIPSAKIQGMIAYSIFGKDLKDPFFLDFTKRQFYFNARENFYFRYLKNLLAINIYLNDQTVFQQQYSFFEKWFKKNDNLNLFFKDILEQNKVYRYLKKELGPEYQIDLLKLKQFDPILSLLCPLVITKDDKETLIFLTELKVRSNLSLQFLSLSTYRQIFEEIILFDPSTQKLEDLKQSFINQTFKQQNQQWVTVKQLTELKEINYLGFKERKQM